MKFIHIADVHIGAKPDVGFPWADKREKEIMDSFRNLITICNEDEVDLLLIAGDLFHKQPLLRELKEVNYCFEKLNKTRVVLIAGNHDYISSRSFYKDFVWSDNVTMLKDPFMDSIFIEDINTEIYGLSYHTRFIMEPLYDKIRPSCEERINILLAHGGQPKDIPIDKNALRISGFHYVALGHIHKPQIFSEQMAYCGSFEPLDKNENGERGYILGEVKEKNNAFKTELTFIPHSARQYIRLDLAVHKDMTNGALLDYAKEKIAEYGRNHIYILRFTGIRDTDILYHKEDFMKIGNVVEVMDETVPDYDFESLYTENQNNIIGLYIKKVLEGADHDAITQKALYYGMEALLNAKNYK